MEPSHITYYNETNNNETNINEFSENSKKMISTKQWYGKFTPNDHSDENTYKSECGIPLAKKEKITGIADLTEIKGLHRNPEEGPAWISYFKNGNIEKIAYYYKGELHNSNGPAIVEYWEDSTLKCEQYIQKGYFFNKSEPFYYFYDPDGNLRCTRIMNETKIIKSTYYYPHSKNTVTTK